jgi:hypothetical protein
MMRFLKSALLMLALFASLAAHAQPPGPIPFYYAERGSDVQIT